MISIFMLINMVVCTKDYERHHQVGYSLYISNDFAKISVSIERLLTTKGLMSWTSLVFWDSLCKDGICVTSQEDHFDSNSLCEIEMIQLHLEPVSKCPIRVRNWIKVLFSSLDRESVPK